MSRSSEPYVPPPLLPGPSSEPGWPGRRRKRSWAMALSVALTVALVAVGASALVPGTPLATQPANDNSALVAPYGEPGPEDPAYGTSPEEREEPSIPTADPAVPPRGRAGTPSGGTDGRTPAPQATAAPRTPTTEAPAPTAGQPDTGAPAPAALAAEVVRLSNAERENAGCDPLKMDQRLEKAAAGHARDMVERKYFDHKSPEGKNHADRIRATGFPQEAATGENIAMGYDSADAVVTGWMNSAGHKRNILNCDYTRIGVGYDPGRIREGYAAGAWVQVFAAL